MTTKFLLSSPEGDIILGKDQLSRPFLISPEEEHPFLTLGDYFSAIEAFLLREYRHPFSSLLSEAFASDFNLDKADIIIRSEKHGNFYHVASIEVIIPPHGKKFAVTTAISQKGKDCLAREFLLLERLNSVTEKSYLPAVYFQGSITVESQKGKEEVRIFLGEWLEDYHEWHLSNNSKTGGLNICIWDHKRGTREATPKEYFEIFRQTARILTIYYDPLTGNQIHPWHHAAGDFIVHCNNGAVAVKLITVRDFQPLLADKANATDNPQLVGLLYFFLNLSVKIRVDRLDGVGLAAWAPNPALNAAVVGFLEGLQYKQQAKTLQEPVLKQFISLLQSCSEEDLFNLFLPLMDLHEDENVEDHLIMQNNLQEHVRELVREVAKLTL